MKKEDSNQSTEPTLDHQGVIGKLLQRMDTLTLSLSEKKKELDSYANKAQESADTLDVASTKLISHMEAFVELESKLNTIVEESIAEVSSGLSEKISQELTLRLLPMIEQLNSASKHLDQNTQKAQRKLSVRGALWIVSTSIFACFIAILTTFVMFSYLNSDHNQAHQKLMRYGSAFISYLDTLPELEQQNLLQKLKPYLE